MESFSPLGRSRVMARSVPWQARQLSCSAGMAPSAGAARAASSRARIFGIAGPPSVPPTARDRPSERADAAFTTGHAICQSHFPGIACVARKDAYDEAHALGPDLHEEALPLLRPGQGPPAEEGSELPGDRRRGKRRD